MCRYIRTDIRRLFSTHTLFLCQRPNTIFKSLESLKDFFIPLVSHQHRVPPAPNVMKCERWMSKNEEKARINASKMVSERILSLSWTAKNTNEGVLETAEVERIKLELIN